MKYDILDEIIRVYFYEHIIIIGIFTGRIYIMGIGYSLRTQYMNIGMTSASLKTASGSIGNFSSLWENIRP